MASENNFVSCVLKLPSVLDGSESKGRFFNKTNRFESIRVTNRIDSNREFECSSCGTAPSVCVCVCVCA